MTTATRVVVEFAEHDWTRVRKILDQDAVHRQRTRERNLARKKKPGPVKSMVKDPKVLSVSVKKIPITEATTHELEYIIQDQVCNEEISDEETTTSSPEETGIPPL